MRRCLDAAPVVTGCGVQGAAARSCNDLLDRLISESISHMGVCRDPLVLEPWLAGRIQDEMSVESLSDDYPDRVILEPVRRNWRVAPLGVRALLMAALEAWTQSGMAGRVADVARSMRHGLILAGQNTANETLLDAAMRFGVDGRLTNGRLMQVGHDSYGLSLVSEVLGLRGEGCVIGAAQTSGHLALVQAARLILAGEADVVLVLGAPTRLSALEVAGYQTIGATAQVSGDESSGRVGRSYRVFDRGASGFVPLETAAAVVLESAGHAAERGATVQARLTAWRSAMHASAQPSPNAELAQQVMREAVALANLGAGDVDLISAHATGTPEGDRAESTAIHAAFGDRAWVNTPKSILGHGLTSAGILETVAGVQQMQSGFLHGCARLDDPVHPGLRYVPSGGVRQTPRVLLNNGFGFGGFNAALVLERPDFRD